MTETTNTKEAPKGPNLPLLGFKTPMDVIDLLAIIKIDDEPVIKEERCLLDPKLKAQAVMEYYYKKFKVDPNDLPYLASLVKKEIKQRKAK